MADVNPSPAPALPGLHVLLTRAADQAEGWRAALEAAGAVVREAPCIRTRPDPDLAAALAGLAGQDWLLLTSPNGATALMAALGGRWPGGPRVAVVGPGTARAAAALGLPVDHVADRPDGLGLAASLAALGVAGARILLPRGDLAAGDLPAALRAAGAAVTEVVAYRTEPDPALAAALAAALADGVPDWVVLASGSAFDALRATWPDLGGTRIATIGPRTSAAVRAAGFEVAAEAAEPTAAGIVAAIEHPAPLP